MSDFKENKKPPIGIMPKNLWLEKINHERFVEIAEAMKRYLDFSTGFVIPTEWLEEYKALSSYAIKAVGE